VLDSEFEFLRKLACSDRAVPEAVWLGQETKRVEQYRREIEEKMKLENPSWVIRELFEHNNRPDVVKADRMNLVELRVLEDGGGAEGKTCTVRNGYNCPYGEESKRLIKEGGTTKFLWKLVQWYDEHWNRSSSFRPSSNEAKWCPYDEPSFPDVTSYDDILKAIENGRMEKILEEYKKYKGNKSQSVTEKKNKLVLLFSYLCLLDARATRVFSGFSINVNGISSSFDIMPKPENIALRLLTSVWLIAPISGAAIRYIARKSITPVASIIQAAATKTLWNK
jgi:hypothetical protein